MSWNPALDPHTPTGDAVDAIETVIIPRARDLGGFEVRRALPAPQRQMVGPFIFFDQFGPAEILKGDSIDVRPHPHIGLATVTYIYEGRMHHRDSLGTDAWIEPGAVNWMVSGHGITHSERTDDATAQGPMTMSGLQTWVALPKDHEDRPAAFEHAPAATLSRARGRGQDRCACFSAPPMAPRAPVKTVSEMFYADAILAPGAAMPLPDDHEDRGVYVVEGEVEVAGDSFEAGRMMIFRPGDRINVTAGTRARGSSFWVARRSRARATSGGTSSPRRRSASTKRRRPGGAATGRTAGSSFRPTMTRSSFRCPTRDRGARGARIISIPRPHPLDGAWGASILRPHPDRKDGFSSGRL